MKCPKCGSCDVESTQYPVVTDIESYHLCECYNCGNLWKEVYDPRNENVGKLQLPADPNFNRNCPN